jgi:hypothetical protein
VHTGGPSANEDRWCENPFSHPARGNPFPRQFAAPLCGICEICGQSIPASRRSQPPADPTRPRRATRGIGPILCAVEPAFATSRDRAWIAVPFSLCLCASVVHSFGFFRAGRGLTPRPATCSPPRTIPVVLISLVRESLLVRRPWESLPARLRNLRNLRIRSLKRDSTTTRNRPIAENGRLWRPGRTDLPSRQYL